MLGFWSVQVSQIRGRRGQRTFIVCLSPGLGFSYPTIPFPDSLLLAGKEGHPGEAKIMSIHEDILDEQVGAATVL